MPAPLAAHAERLTVLTINVSSRVLQLSALGLTAGGIVHALAREGVSLPLSNVQRILERPATACPPARRESAGQHVPAERLT